MSYTTETVHTVNGTQVTVKELTSWSEYHVFIGGDKYEVFRGLPQDGQNPDCWYTEVGGVIEGPYGTAEQLIAELFLDPDGA